MAGGTLGFGLRPEVRIWDERFGLRTEGGVTIEEIEALGLDFTTSDFGSGLPGLGPSQDALRTLTGDPGLDLRVGASVARLNALEIRLPLTASLGITDWLTVSATVPFVRRRMEVDFTLSGDGATVGFSPGNADDAVTLYISQLQQAIANVLQAADAFCAGVGEMDPDCMDLRAVVDDAQLFLDDLDAGYASTFFPLPESPGASALDARVQALRARMLAAGDSATIEQTWTAPLPLASGGAAGDLSDLFLDPEVGILAVPLDGFQSVWELGDVEAGVWVRLLDLGAPSSGPVDATSTGPAASDAPPLRLHVAAGATVRLGTGSPDLAENFVDLGSGDGQNDVEVHGFGYLGIGSRIAARGLVRYGIQMAGDVERRIGAPDQPIRPFDSQALLRWDPGDYLDVLVAPEFRLTPELSLAGRYRFHRRGTDRYTTGAPPAGFDPALLNAETRQMVHHVGGAVTVWPSARTRLAGQWPLAATVSYDRAIVGSGGQTPKDGRVAVDVRVFFGIW